MDSSPPLREKKDSFHDLPIVFQCENCRTIIGDSFASVSSNSTLKMVTLDRVTKKVRIRDKLVSSSHTTDLGSSYNPLACETCNSDLGRIYRTTTIHLDELRDKFSLYVDRLSCYQIGSEEQKASLSSAAIPSVHYLQQQIIKLQAVSVSLNGRLMEIEDRLKEDSS
ncbi:hypothetical protein LOTGIDRAFT_234549 [Lottia gigantea]|uniref:Mis18 domain-containing protein n=1 Tax=Lottia gigantea TaxID=225164 RepID=V4BIP7_LOTGI|nr:hypothetical protein LOTGIDRAFT_234549 [Lottia gigantea]ESO88494.1 hypothetical protein LOTGIDRAFT_234549 [Lottia gigantea]